MPKTKDTSPKTKDTHPTLTMSKTKDTQKSLPSHIVVDVEEIDAKETGNGSPITEGEEVAKKVPNSIFTDEKVAPATLPLEEKVIEKPYTGLPEISETTAEAEEETVPSEQFGNMPSSGDIPAAPVVDEDEDQKAEQTVMLFFRAYEKFHALGRYFGKVDTDKISAKHIAGKTNLNYTFPVGKKTISLGGFVQEYNDAIDKEITVEDEFKNDFTPPAIRVAKKHKLFVGDEITCGLIFGEDLLTKASKLVGLKLAVNEVLKSVEEDIRKRRAREPVPPKEAEKSKAKKSEKEEKTTPTEETPPVKDGEQWRENE